MSLCFIWGSFFQSQLLCTKNLVVYQRKCLRASPMRFGGYLGSARKVLTCSSLRLQALALSEWGMVGEDSGKSAVPLLMKILIWRVSGEWEEDGGCTRDCMVVWVSTLWFRTSMANVLVLQIHHGLSWELFSGNSKWCNWKWKRKGICCIYLLFIVIINF